MTNTIRIVAGSALVLAAACAVPLGATPGAVSKTDPKAPVACSLAISESRGTVTVAGRIEAREAVSGHYDLSVSRSGGGNSADIRQGGAFSLAAGEAADLGSAQLSGRASGLDGALTVTVNGETFACPTGG
jgi:hypothetical protein